MPMYIYTMYVVVVVWSGVVVIVLWWNAWCINYMAAKCDEWNEVKWNEVKWNGFFCQCKKFEMCKGINTGRVRIRLRLGYCSSVHVYLLMYKQLTVIIIFRINFPNERSFWRIFRNSESIFG